MTGNGDVIHRTLVKTLGPNCRQFLPRCMECRRGLAMRILSVRPSVCPVKFSQAIGEISCSHKLPVYDDGRTYSP